MNNKLPDIISQTLGGDIPMNITKIAQFTPQGFEIVETVDGDYMVLCQGIQWGKGPRDLSGCSSETWPTKQAAYEAIVERERDRE